MSAILGIPVVNNLGRYLGVPILHNRMNKNMYKGVQARVVKKLSTWHAKFLSLAGRLTLIQSILAMIPLYTMQTTSMPMITLKKIEQHCRSFFFGGAAEGVNVGGRKLSLVKWEDVCDKPKEIEGLNIRKLKECNQAFMMKSAWQIASSREALWIRIIKDKYMKESWPNPDMAAKGTLHVWSRIRKSWEKMRSQMKWSVISGNRVRF